MKNEAKKNNGSKRKSGRHKTKAQIEEAERSKSKRPKSVEEWLDDGIVLGVVYDGLLVTRETEIDLEKSTIVINSADARAAEAAEVLYSTGANVILSEAPPVSNKIVTEAFVDGPNTEFKSTLEEPEPLFDVYVERSLPAERDPEHPIFASVLLAERQDALSREREYTDEERNAILAADMEYARMFEPYDDKYAGMSKTEEYERRAVEFYRNTVRKTRSRLNKAQAAELQEVYNFLFADNIKIGSCDLCAVRCYSKLEKLLQKRKLI